jgi:hypothetical protein
MPQARHDALKALRRERGRTFCVLLADQFDQPGSAVLLRSS